MPRARKAIRVELTRADLVEAASSVHGVLNRRTAAGASSVEFELVKTAGEGTDGVLAVVTFICDKNAPVT